MKIERAKISDSEEITELTIRSKSFWNYGEEQIEAWRDELTVSGDYIVEHHLYKMLDDKLLVGYYAYEILSPTNVKLTHLFVDPDSIGKGYGKALLSDFMKRMHVAQFKKVTLDADPHAEQFYVRMGFQVVGQLQSSIKDRFLPIMEKEI